MFPGVLWCGAAPELVIYLTRGAVNPNTWTHCGLPCFLFYFSLTYSSALLIVMVVEKCFVLYFPFKAKIICTVRTAKIVCFILALLFAIFSCQFFFIVKLRTLSNGQDTCLFLGAPSNYYEILFDVISIIYSYVPFVIMILGNGAIFCKFMPAKWKARNASSENTSQALNKTALSGLFMLLAISVAFLILTGPIAIANNVYDIIPPTIFAVTLVLKNLNHGINCVLYCISGSRFRKELIQTLSCAKVTGNVNANLTAITNTCSSGSTVHEMHSSKF